LNFVVAVLWHSLGIYTCWCYVSLAPKPHDTWPLLAVGIYEWFGLIPAAFAVSEAALAGRLRSGVWHLWGGSLLGAVVGALVGFIAGGVWLFLPHGTGSEDGGYDWWMYGALGGGIVVGGTFVVWRLLNLGARWKAKSVGGEPSSQTPVRVTVCRTCGSRIERGPSVCPYCREPVRRWRLRVSGSGLSKLGVVCFIVGMLLPAASGVPLLGKAIEPFCSDPRFSYVIWALLILGLLLMGVGTILSPDATARQGEKPRQNAENEKEQGTSPDETGFQS
jgi:H+/Cl- antiporter ClcA